MMSDSTRLKLPSSDHSERIMVWEGASMSRAFDLLVLVRSTHKQNVNGNRTQMLVMTEAEREDRWNKREEADLVATEARDKGVGLDRPSNRVPELEKDGSCLSSNVPCEIPDGAPFLCVVGRFSPRVRIALCDLRTWGPKDSIERSGERSSSNNIVRPASQREESKDPSVSSDGTLATMKAEMSAVNLSRERWKAMERLIHVTGNASWVRMDVATRKKSWRKALTFSLPSTSSCSSR